MDNRPLIFFDDVDYQVRVLESDKFKETERLHEECKAFVDSNAPFHYFILFFVYEQHFFFFVGRYFQI